MYLGEHTKVKNACPSIMDSPTLVRVENATKRQEGKSVFRNQINSFPGHAIQKGLLWQQRDKIFARWKERYFILTRDYLHCFRKATENGLDKISDMGPFIFKIKLVDVEKIIWVNKKTYSATVLDLGREGRILLRTHQGLEDWFDSLEECIIASKERRRALKNFRDSYQIENEQSLNSCNSNIEDWLVARRKIAQFQKNCTSDSVSNLTKLIPSSRNSMNEEIKYSNEEKWHNETLSASNQRLSLLTDIDTNTLDSSPCSTRLRTTPTPCRLNSDIFFLPGFSVARQRCSIAGVAIQSTRRTNDCERTRLGSDSSKLKPRNFLGSFRAPTTLFPTKGTVSNRYSLIDDTNSLNFIYSTYGKAQNPS